MSFVWLKSFFSLPGVVVHEFSHKFFCEISGVRVQKICYFRFGNPAGFVVHDEAENFLQSFFITIGPFILGTIFAAVCFFAFEKNSESFYRFLYLWFGISIAINCFPSSGDAKSFFTSSRRHFWKNPLAITGFPIALLLWLISLLHIFWIQYFYAAALLWTVHIFAK